MIRSERNQVRAASEEKRAPVSYCGQTPASVRSKRAAEITQTPAKLNAANVAIKHRSFIIYIFQLKFDACVAT